MKNIFLLMLFCLGVSYSCQAQVPERYTKQAPDTCINQDTVYVTFTAIPSNIRALEAKVTKISGTINTASYVILQATVDGTNWFDVNTDTLTLANQTTNYKVWLLTSTSYYSYRIRYITPSSTQRTVLAFLYMRRPDE